MFPSRHLTLLLLWALLPACGDDRKPAATDQGTILDQTVKDLPSMDHGSGDAPQLDRAAKDTAASKPDAPSLDSAQVDAPLPDGPAANTIGPAGGTAKSADGKAELVVPAGALGGPITFTLIPAWPPPLVTITQDYMIGPASTPFIKPPLVRIAYSQSNLAGALEENLKLGRGTSSGRAPIHSSFVEVVGNKVSALVASLGTFAVISGGKQADVAKVVPAAPATLFGAPAKVGAPGGTSPLRGIAMDAKGYPLKGAVLTYSSAKPTVLSVNLTTGTMAGKTLSSPPQQESVTLTIKASAAVKSTLPVTVTARTKTMVNMVGKFSLVGISAAGESPLGGAQLSLYGSSPGTVTANAGGNLTSLPPLPAGSINTLRAAKGAAYLESHYSGIAPTVDQPGQAGSFYLLDPKLAPATVCGTVPRHQGLGAILVVKAPAATSASGWTYYISSPGAFVRYLNKSWAPICAQESSGASGRALVVNVAPGDHWLLAMKGAAIQTRLVRVLSGKAVVPVSFQ